MTVGGNQLSDNLGNDPKKVKIEKTNASIDTWNLIKADMVKRHNS